MGDNPRQPRYRPGGRSFELYRELMAGFARTTSDTRLADEPIHPEEVVCVPAAVEYPEPDRLEIDDPL